MSNPEYDREAEFIKQRRKENRRVGEIAQENGLLGENSSLKNAVEFATHSRVLNQELLGQVFKKAGLSNPEDKE